MDRHSDTEELLSDAPRAPKTWVFPRAAAAILGGVGLLGVGFVGLKSSPGLRSKSRNYLGLEAVECFEQGMFYTSPHKLDSTERSVELSAEACQTRCQVVPECSHFTYWPDGGCLLTGEESYVKAAPFKYSATVTGPKFCKEAIEAAQDAVSAAGEAASGLDAQSSWGASIQHAADSVTSGVQGAASAVADAATGAVGSATEAVQKVVATVGLNGTACSAYPACVSVGITEGDCCPNTDKVSLGCCAGFPKMVEEVKIAAGSECTLFPQCMSLNITGACCPTPEGVRLGCCGPEI
ncbi:unnamed protein product [Effrenium voratum]|uniref:Apple domain-containing protein n=1 Tax=Effrenium voratum TaxID=2562239 RepID=A0AA36IZP1_9DINO|nr:unnamed protein product [Effrenium voratum]